jgi:hypothetical protein
MRQLFTYDTTKIGFKMTGLNHPTKRVVDSTNGPLKTFLQTGRGGVARSCMAGAIWSISRGFCDQSGVMSMSIRLLGRFDGG